MKKALVLLCLLTSILYFVFYILIITNCYSWQEGLIDSIVAIGLVIGIVFVRWEWEIRGCFDRSKYILLRKTTFYILLMVQIYNLLQYYIHNRNHLQFQLLYYGFISFMALVLFFSYGFGMRRAKWRINLFG